MSTGGQMLGTEIDHYRILKKLGEGGMGIVYKAMDTRLQRTVALKLLPPDMMRDPQAKERFVFEAQAASALDHPNICTIHEINETADNQVYIVMACYEGETLDKKIGGCPLAIEAATDIASQLATGLAKAHERGIVHRDIKPANIFVTNEGLVKILDFGLAKLALSSTVNLEGTRVGTVAYMSPEQARGEVIDARTDIWAFGAVVYEMLTGSPPFGKTYEQAVIYSILNEDPKPLPSDGLAIPDNVAHIVACCLKKDRGQRYQSFDKVLTELNPEKRYLRFLTALRDLPQQVVTLRRVVTGLAMVVLVAILYVMFQWINGPVHVADEERFVLRGRVQDSTGTPIRDASITLNAIHFKAFTRDDGTFLGVIDVQKSGEKVILIVAHPQFRTRKIDRILMAKEEDFGTIVLGK